jgi:hypothetical protein
MHGALWILSLSGAGWGYFGGREGGREGGWVETHGDARHGSGGRDARGMMRRRYNQRSGRDSFPHALVGPWTCSYPRVLLRRVRDSAAVTGQTEEALTQLEGAAGGSPVLVPCYYSIWYIPFWVKHEFHNR